MGRYDDTDEVEETESSVQTKAAPQPRVINRGWAAADKLKTANSPYAQRLKLTEEPIVIKFLEDEPYASWHSHWLDGRKGQQSFTCIRDIDPKGCPLCDMGSRAPGKFAFNVILLERGTEPMVRSYEVGIKVVDQLKNFHTDPRMGPLTKNYWAVSRTGTAGTSATNHQPIKERDLLDDWGVSAVDEDTIRTLRSQGYGPDIIPIPDYKTLKTIAFEEQDD